MAWKHSLSLSLVLLSLGSAIYVEDPMLYDTFPSDFIWATATSSYQVEGAWNVDGKGPSIWDTFVRQNGTISDGTNGDDACNSYYLYERDVEMMKALGVSHYRFSVSWPRVLPQGTGAVNALGVQYYKNLVAALKRSNIEPMVTLYHWDLPQALEDQGGFLNPSMADWFEEYARLLYTELGNDVKLWITFNEPWCVAYLGYGDGSKAPGKKETGTSDYIAAHNLLRAHAKAYRLYEREFKPTQQGKVGITLNINWAEPKDNSPESLEASERLLQFDLGWYANPIFGNGDYPQVMKDQIARKSQAQGLAQSRLPEFTAAELTDLKGSADFFGLNFYTSSLAENHIFDDTIVGFSEDKDVATSVDPSWYGSASEWLKVTPFGIRKLLGWVNTTYNSPEIIITENGYSEANGDLDDLMRIYYYRYYINNVLRAIKDGVRVRGYTAWSLMDNFEWERGYSERFGMHNVDFASSNKTRTPKSSAEYFARIVRNNGFVRDHFCDDPQAPQP